PGAPITLVLGGGAGGGMSAEAAAKNAELKKTFEEGVAASRAGNHDDAIAKFTKAAELNTNCYDCYYNIAYSEAQKKDLEKAEAHYQLGMALVNEGNLAGAGAEFEKYVQLAPNGPNAATAKGILATIKK